MALVPTSVSQVFRHVVAVIAGYLVFALLSIALFALSHRDPHVAQDWVFKAFSIVYGILAAVLAGYLAGAIGGGGRPMVHARTLALAIAAVAIVSLLGRPGGGAVWTQLAAILLFAPCALLGGWLRSLRG
jgi:hypothetical protein